MGTTWTLPKPSGTNTDFRKQPPASSAPSIGKRKLQENKPKKKRHSNKSLYSTYRTSLVESEGTQTQTWTAWLRRVQQILDGSSAQQAPSDDGFAKDSRTSAFRKEENNNLADLHRDFQHDNKRAVENTEERMRRLRIYMRWRRAAQRAIESSLVPEDSPFVKAVQDWREKYYNAFDQDLAAALTAPYSRHICTDTTIPISATSYSSRPISKTLRLKRSILAKCGSLRTESYYSKSSLLRIASLLDFNRFLEAGKKVGVAQEFEANPLVPQRATKYFVSTNTGTNLRKLSGISITSSEVQAS